MNNSAIPFHSIDWGAIPKEEHKGERGTAWSQTIDFGSLRVRIVEYSAEYRADHWCQKGHIVHCLNGEFTSELENGETSIIKKSMTYLVSDDLSSHRSKTENGATLMIIDGDFLGSI